jgi:predicted heme/steroid binding protein
VAAAAATTVAATAAAAGGKTYTWEEVAEHNTEKSLWVTVRGKVYDISSWVNNHPGGKEILLLAAGRDITYAFDSYHPFTEKPTQVGREGREGRGGRIALSSRWSVRGIN